MVCLLLIRLHATCVLPLLHQCLLHWCSPRDLLQSYLVSAKLPTRLCHGSSGLLRWPRRSGRRHSSTWQITRCCLRACCSSLPWSLLEQTLERRYCICVVAFCICCWPKVYCQHPLLWLALGMISARCAVLEHGVVYSSVMYCAV